MTTDDDAMIMLIIIVVMMRLIIGLSHRLTMSPDAELSYGLICLVQSDPVSPRRLLLHHEGD